MKETELKTNEKQEVEAVAPISSEKKHIGRLTLKRGLKVWEVLPVKQDDGGIVFMVKEAEYDDSSIGYSDASKGKNTANKKIVIKNGCFYVQALNHKNALKKFLKSRSRK